MYSPLGLVIFVAVERTCVCFTKSHEHFILNYIRYGCIRTDQCNIACSKTAINRNALAIDRRPPPHAPPRPPPIPPPPPPPARRRRTVPCDLRRASLPVPPLFSYTVSWNFVFKEVVRYAAHRVWYSFASVVHDSSYW